MLSFLKIKLTKITESTVTFNFCLLVSSANSLDPNQAQQNVRPDLDPNCLELL